MRYLILDRALQNAGDHLIHRRAVELISAARPEAQLTPGAAWKPLGDQFSRDELESFDAVVICGGPGFQARMFPRIYPLMPLHEFRPRLILLSMGSFFFPADGRAIERHRLDDPTLKFLRWVAGQTPMISTRDDLSFRLLERAGISGVVMTGDVAWYAPGPKTWTPPADLQHVAFTPPANPLFFRDGIDLLRALREWLPEARITVVFHRGRQVPFERAGDEIGADSIDISGSDEGFSFYDSVSVHVGYRVHAHLYRLSLGGLSYLAAEDSRGVGVLQTLGGIGVDPFAERRRSPLIRRIWSLLPRVGSPKRPITRSVGLLASGAFRYGDISAKLIAQIERDAREGYLRQRAVTERIAATRSVMETILDTLP